MPIANYGLLASGSGATEFIDLTDVPASYSGEGLKSVRVNTGATALEFYTPGTLSDGDKGDITVSGSGATWTIDAGVVNASKLASDSVETAKILNANVTADKLATDSVITAKITDANVTLAKVQNIATASLLGRVTAETGVSEVLTATQVRTLLNVEDGADVTDNANVITALNAISGVTEGDILIFNGTNWVRLARGTDNQVLTATASTVNWENASSGFEDPMTTEGDIIYKTSGGVTTRLARGTDGQVLTATAGSINWENASGGAETLQSRTVSTQLTGADTLDFDNGRFAYVIMDADLDLSAVLKTASVQAGYIYIVKFKATGANRTLTKGASIDVSSFASTFIVTQNEYVTMYLSLFNSEINLEAISRGA